jgi:hypothetical protein
MSDPGAPMPPSKPPAVSNKVAAGGLGAAVAIIIIYAIEGIFHYQIDAVLSASITTVITFVIGYVVPEAKQA